MTDPLDTLRTLEARIAALEAALSGVRDGHSCWCSYYEAIGEHAYWCKDAQAALAQPALNDGRSSSVQARVAALEAALADIAAYARSNYPEWWTTYVTDLVSAALTPDASASGGPSGQPAPVEEWPDEGDPGPFAEGITPDAGSEEVGRG